MCRKIIFSYSVTFSVSRKTYSLSKLVESHALLPTKVQFDQDDKWNFKIGDQEYTNVNFGTLEVQREYTEDFLIGNAIHSGR